jgi:hypothetical protein
MAGGAVKDARIQPQGLPLNAFSATSALQTAGILAVIGQAAARLTPGRGNSRRAQGRHAAPARHRKPRPRHGQR